MSFRGMKLLVPIILYMIIGLGSVSATTFYTWTGTVKIGSQIHVNDLTLTVDQDNITKELALIIYGPEGFMGLLKDGEEGIFEGLTISFKEFNDYGIVDISSEKPFSIGFNITEEVAQLQEENTHLKITISNLTGKLQELQEENQRLKEKINTLQAANSKNNKKSEDFNALQVKILNLTRENRKLRGELANLTNRFNQLKAENDFMKSQLETYKSVFSGLVQQAEKQSEKTYVEEAKDAKKDAKRLWRAAIVSTLVVGGFGVLMYRKKRKYELE